MKNVLMAVLFLLPILARSQSGVIRIELDAALNSNIYQVVPCESRGVLVFFETKDMTGENSKNWHFKFYDRGLEEAWNTNIPVVMGADYKDYVLKDSLLILFFLNSGKVKTGAENFELIHFDLAQGISYAVTGTLPAEANFQEIIIDQSRAYLALNTKNDQAGVFFIDIRKGTVSPFNILYPDQNFIEDLCLDTLNHQLLCLVSNYLERRQNKLFLQVLDTSGQFVKDMEILPVLESKYLNTGRIYPLPDSSIMILGAYGGIAAKIPSSSEYFGVESSGVFSTRIRQDRQEFMNYYNFMEFNNLKAGVSARDYYRLQKKKVRETNEYSVNYELLFHDPVSRDSTLILFVEAFYPEFRTVSDISYDYWGRPVTQTYTVFDGYRIFNTILAGFNYQGELQWDNSLEVNMSPSGQLLKRSSCYFDGEPSLLFYNDGFRLAYRIYMDNTELAGFSRMDLETSHQGDRITAAGYNAMVHWYDRYFLAYGYHNIQNNLLADKSERTVFYINKIALE